MESHPPVPVSLPGKPIPLNSSEQSALDSPVYAKIVDGQSNRDALFGTLTSSRYAIPYEWLGDTSKNGDIIAAIKKVYRIVRAQMLRGTTGAWRNFNDTTSSASLVTQDKLPIPPVDAELHRNASRTVQNEAATYILVGLSTAIFILNALLIWLSKVHGYRRAVPEPLGTIVAMASLFADSTFCLRLSIRYLLYRIDEQKRYTKPSLIPSAFLK
ncbi:hypothetical protein F5Y11DRAFT_250661 [Daldinia sp. FL1419]|nr:hypothetical protein F5Y11DRAFT_250661 [Daldinia sp. FL1419]